MIKIPFTKKIIWQQPIGSDYYPEVTKSIFLGGFVHHCTIFYKPFIEIRYYLKYK